MEKRAPFDFEEKKKKERNTYPQRNINDVRDYLVLFFFGNENISCSFEYFFIDTLKILFFYDYFNTYY